MNFRPSLLVRAAVLAITLCSPGARAVTIDDGDLAYVPHGTDLGLVYQQHSEGHELYAQGKKVSDDARLSVDVTMLRAVAFRDWGSQVTVAPQFLLPMGTARTGGSMAGVDATHGVGDLLLVLPVHFIKDATGREAFVMSSWLWLPTGRYDKNRGLNPFGENRWKVAFQVGRIWKVSEPLSFELVGDGQFFGNNNDHGPTSTTLQQKTLWELQAHTRYFLFQSTFLGVLFSHSEGGATVVGGVHQDDRQLRNKVLFTLGLQPRPDLQFLVSAGQDLLVRTGIKEASRINLRVMKAL